MKTSFCLDDSPHFRMVELDIVDSTNSFLRGYHPLQPADIILVTAEYQTAGRGQQSNAWESERGKNLLFSLLLHPSQLPATQMFVLSEAIALSIRDAINLTMNEAANGDPSLNLQPLKIQLQTPAVTVKWPNDLYVGDSKVAGILIENDIAGQYLSRSIIGCGVNINQKYFQSDAPNPVSLLQLTGRETERQLVLQAILSAFVHRYDLIQQGEYASIHADYRHVLYRGSGQHLFYDADGTFRAAIVDVQPDGHLLLRDEDGKLRCYAHKEVTFLPSDCDDVQG